MTITNIISAIGNNSSVYPLIVRDCGIEVPAKILLTYNQNKKDDKEIGKLKELIETQQSLMVSGIIGGKDAVKKQDELKRQLKERMISVKEIEENDKTVKDQGNNLPAIIKKENILN